jgi:hypothetical protein
MKKLDVDMVAYFIFVIIIVLIISLTSCSQPTCPKVVTKWEVLDTVEIIGYGDRDTGKIKYKHQGGTWEAFGFGHNCTMHQVLIENLGDSNEVVTIGAPGDMRLVKSPGEVVNFMLDSMGYHLVRNCLEYSGFQ